MGVFILLIIILGFVIGALRNELALSLTSAVFLVLWVYCLLCTLLCALLCRRQAGRLSARIPKREISAGDLAEAVFSGIDAVSRNAGKAFGFFRLPGIVMRYRLLLQTADGREIRHDCNPAHYRKQNRNAAPMLESFAANERGGFFSDYDEFAVFDILGFFRFVYRIPCEAGYRLLVCPHPAAEPVPPELQAGGTEHPSETQVRRTDNLIDHRPYIPGDDPRRINWKLYGHGNELFVREGEREPPPHSNALILIDTHCDTLLYTAKSGRQGVDLLCENALACALELTRGGIDVRFGFTGLCETVSSAAGAADTSAFLHGNSPSEFAAICARPAAIPWQGASTAGTVPMLELPAPPADCGILVFALPRVNAESSALSRFLDKAASADSSRFVELFFMYEGRGGDLDEAAGLCAAFYRRRQNLRVRLIKAGD